MASGLPDRPGGRDSPALGAGRCAGLGAGRCERRPGGAPTRARKTQPGVSAAARARRSGDDCPDRGARRRAPRSDRDARADVKPGRRIQALVGTAPAANLATGPAGCSFGGATLRAHLLSHKAGACACPLHRAQRRAAGDGRPRPGCAARPTGRATSVSQNPARTASNATRGDTIECLLVVEAIYSLQAVDRIAPACGPRGSSG
jgi:hypothetical protein